MARARSIKPGFFKNETLAELSPFARILFAGLWTLADREGRLEDRPKRIKAEILPYDAEDCNELLQQLESKKFIVRYEVGGERYLYIPTFKRHQNPNVKEQASTIPAPCEHSTNTVLVLPLSPSLLPSSPNPNPLPTVCVRANGNGHRTEPTLWDWFAETYRGELSPDNDCRVFLSVIQTPDDEERIRANLPLWNLYPRWEDPRYIPSAENFLAKRKWKNPPKQMADYNPHEIEYPNI